MRNLLFNCFFSVVVIFVFAGCKDVKPVDIGEIQGVKLKSIGTDGVSLEIQLPIKNPNDFAFKVKKINLQAEVNGYNLGKITHINKIEVLANSNQVYSLLLDVKFKETFKETMSLIQSFGTKNANVKLVGFIKVSAFMISKKIKIDQDKKVNLSKFKL